MELDDGLGTTIGYAGQPVNVRRAVERSGARSAGLGRGAPAVFPHTPRATPSRSGIARTNDVPTAPVVSSDRAEPVSPVSALDTATLDRAIEMLPPEVVGEQRIAGASAAAAVGLPSEYRAVAVGPPTHPTLMGVTARRTPADETVVAIDDLSSASPEAIPLAPPDRAAAARLAAEIGARTEDAPPVGRAHDRPTIRRRLARLACCGAPEPPTARDPIARRAVP